MFSWRLLSLVLWASWLQASLHWQPWVSWEWPSWSLVQPSLALPQLSALLRLQLWAALRGLFGGHHDCLLETKTQEFFYKPIKQVFLTCHLVADGQEGFAQSISSSPLGQRLTAASTLGFLALGALGFFAFESACKSIQFGLLVSLPLAGHQIGHSYVDITFLVVAFLTAGFFAAGFLAAFLSSSLSL